MTITGSPVFWLLLVIAVVAIVTYFERMMDFRRARIDYQDFLKGVVNVLDSGGEEEALAICEDNPSPVAQIVATAIRNRKNSAVVLHDAVDSQGRAEIGRLDRRLAILAIIAQVAPAIGFLGTVIGFIKTVMMVNSFELVFRVDLINGSMEALVSAAMGLAVSIVTVVMYGSLRVRLERIIVESSTAASLIISYLSAKKTEEPV